MSEEVKQLPDGWRAYSIKDIIKFKSQGVNTTTEKVKYSQYGIKVIRAKNIDDYTIDYDDVVYVEDETYSRLSNNNKPQKNDILYTNIGSKFGSAAIIKSSDKILIAWNVLRIVVNESLVNNHFLMYVLNCPFYKNKLLALNSSATMPFINGKSIDGFEIKVPPLEEQKEIAAVLSTLDDKIEINQQINKKLEEMAQAIFQQWFIDFNFPDENGNPYKDSGGAMIDSELGQIPAGWTIKNLDQIAEFTNGLAMQKFRPKEHEKSLPVLKIKELRQGYTDINSDRCSDNIAAKVKVFNGDIIFSWSGSLMVDIWSGGNAGLNQHLFKVTSDNYAKCYYYLWTKYHLNQFIAIAEDKATTMGHIQRKHLSDAKVICTNNIYMNNFNNTLTPVIDSYLVNSIEIKKLSTIRDLLLPKLMSGDLEIQNNYEINDKI
jgi:type I restriction enzyme S subunit